MHSYPFVPKKLVFVLFQKVAFGSPGIICSMCSMLVTICNWIVYSNSNRSFIEGFSDAESEEQKFFCSSDRTEEQCKPLVPQWFAPLHSANRHQLMNEFLCVACNEYLCLLGLESYIQQQACLGEVDGSGSDYDVVTFEQFAEQKRLYKMLPVFGLCLHLFTVFILFQ